VLYFRSLKASNVLNHLTSYLFQYKSVSIPNVGTLQLVQQPSQLNVVDKLILPPTYFVELKKDDKVSTHQLVYLNQLLQRGIDEVERDLVFFGGRLQEKINGPGFTWEGLGTFTPGTQTLPLAVKALAPVPAERIIRQDARHQVLVGDQQRLSGTGEETEAAVKSGRSVLIIIGWVLLLLSLLFIGYHLYTGRFRINSTGSKQSPVVYKQSAPTGV
jgi:hypothetical protein